MKYYRIWASGFSTVVKASNVRTAIGRGIKIIGELDMNRRLREGYRVSICVEIATDFNAEKELASKPADAT